MHAFCPGPIPQATILILCLFGSALPVSGVPIVNDPDGFGDLSWGTILSETEHFVKIEDSGRVQTYEQIGRSPLLGHVAVDSIRFTTFEKKFGRVTIRYSGQDTHEDILLYLQSTYGPLDRTPGQITVGPIKVYAWHGVSTDVTLRFDATLDRGIIFFESRTLPEKLADGTSGTVF
ncbi:MAG: hypothetical protein QM706_06750 [Nitrospira sp.]